MDATTDVIIQRAQIHEGWGPVLMLSIAAHVGLIAGVALLPSQNFADDVPRTVMSISLGGAPGPRAGGMTPIGGRAVQEIATAAAKPRAEAPPAPKTPEMTLPSPNARRQPQPQAESRDASGRTTTKGDEVREGSARTDTGARGTGFGLTTGGGTGAGAYLDVGDFCCPEYLEGVVQTIQRNWNPRQNVNGQTLMKFTIDRNGALSDVQIERPSGFVALDLAAQRALLLTQRVPPLPGPFPNPNLTVHLRFEYQR